MTRGRDDKMTRGREEDGAAHFCLPLLPFAFIFSLLPFPTCNLPYFVRLFTCDKMYKR
jgi:hypothetical protein